MLTVAVPKRNKLQNIIVLTPKDGKKCVLVIDDIYTTGNTIHRVAKVLKNAGAQKVYFLTISIGQGL